MKTKAEKGSLNKRIILIGIFFMLPAVIVMLFTIVIPLVWNFVLSFAEWNGNSDTVFVGIKNYLEVFKDRATRTSIVNSLLIGVVSTTVAMIVGIVLALCLYRLKRIESAICRFVFYSPSMMPMTIIGLLFTFILAQENGLLNSVLKLIGLGSLQTAWLSNPKTVLWVLSVVQGWKFSGTIMMLCYTAMITIPGSLFEAAKLEGTNYFQDVRLIILPLIKPTIKLALSMMLLWSFKTYDIVWTMTRGGPGGLSLTAPIQMVRTAFTFNKYGYAAAIGMVLTVLVSICIVLGRRLAKGETYEY